MLRLKWKRLPATRGTWGINAPEYLSGGRLLDANVPVPTVDSRGAALLSVVLVFLGLLDLKQHSRMGKQAWSRLTPCCSGPPAAAAHVER